MKSLGGVFFFVFIVIVSACNKDEEQFTCCDFEISYETESDLSRNWSLVGIIQTRPFLEECADGAGGRITFNPDGTYSGSYPCNGMGGDYTLSGSNKIEITNNYQTLRGCYPEESVYWEERFSSEIRRFVRYEIEGDKLILFTSDNTQLVFKAFE